MPSRRSVLKLMFAGASASLLAACGQVPQTPAPPPTAAPAPTAATGAAAKPAATVVSAAAAPTSQPAAATTPKTGGILKQGYQGDPTSLDPMLKVGNDAMWIGVF